MSKADDILFFDVIFLLMVATFSSATSDFSLSLYTNQIFAPWPSAPPLTTIKNCVWYDLTCNIQNQATAGGLGVIGGGVVWFMQMAFSFFNRIIIFGNLITFLMFNPVITGSGGVPFLPVIIVGLNVYVVWELIRTFRGSSTGV